MNNTIKTHSGHSLRHSGHSLRHSHNIQITKLKSDTAKQKELIEKIGESNGIDFKKICNLLVIGLRDRYSGSNNSDSKYFNTFRINGNIRITTEGLKTLLNTKIPGKPFTDDDCHLILALCTHRHTSFSSVESYPSNLANILKSLRASLDKEDLLDLKNQLNQNVNRLGDYTQYYIMLANKNLQFMDLRGANLRGADLSGANLSVADLSRADLRGAKLSGADLSRADLSEAYLPGADLSGADLRHADLRGADLRGAKLSRADLSGADLSGADLSGAQLRGADLSRANLSGANLSGAQLRGADLIGANLRGADLSRADLRGAQLRMAILRAADFKDAVFDADTQIKLSAEEMCNLDLAFNHLNNPSGSILTTIKSINDEYKVLKNNLMCQVFSHLKDKDINEISEALLDILFNSSFDYTEALTQAPEFTDKLLQKIYTKGNTGALTLAYKQIILHNNLLNKMNKETFTQFVENNNGFFIQLIHQSKNKELYTRYLQVIKVVTNDLPPQLIPELSDFEMTYEIDKLLSAELLVLISKKEIDKPHEHLIIKPSYLEKHLYNKEGDVSWNYFTYMINTKPQALKNSDLNQIFRKFKLFLNTYKFAQKHVQFIKLLNILKLGDEHNNFLEAISNKSSAIKYITSDRQDKLNTIFNKVLTKSVTEAMIDHANRNKNSINGEHITAILTEYGFKDKTSLEQAKLLLTLSGIFAKYSSSSFFGTEDDSPTALRYYAYGLMKAASGLDNTIIPVNYTKNDNDDWENKFTGDGGAYTCTAVLSSAILAHCKTFADFKTLLSGVIPPAWA